MKKFVIISAVLLLLAAGAFGFALYRYMQVNDMFSAKEPEATEAVAEKADEKSKATEAKTAKTDTNTSAESTNVFAANLDKASTYVADLSTEEMVGQLLLGVCADTTTASSEINKYSLAGFLFESAGFQAMSKEEISGVMQGASAQAKIKPILAAQEEGGTYTTFSDLPVFSEYDFNSPRTEFDAGGLQAVEKAEEEKTTMLKSIGINLNLAPSLDLASSSDQIMYSRSISDDADTVSAYAEYVAKFHQAKGVSAALKHFPGYGTIPDSANTGVGAVVDERDAETIRTKDYAPFKKGVAAGVHVVMVSNVVVKNIDSAHTAALSPTIHTELRGTVGFTGVIMTDVLDNADYSAYAEGKKPVVQAVLAGNDLILVRDYATAYSDILAAVKAGTINESQIKEACTRVLAYKYTAGIMK